MQRDHRRIKTSETERVSAVVDIPDSVVEELAALHARVEFLESGFGDMIKAVKAKANKAANAVMSKVHKATEHVSPLDKLKHLLESKKILFASDSTSIMISHGANTFHIEADGADTLKVNYAEITKEHLSPQNALDVIQGRNLAAIFTPPSLVRGPPPMRLVPSAALLQYTAAIVQQQQQQQQRRTF